MGTPGPQGSWHLLWHPLYPDVLSFPAVFTWVELGWQVTAVTQCWQATLTKCCQPGESCQAAGAKEEECGQEGGVLASSGSASDA